MWVVVSGELVLAGEEPGAAGNVTGPGDGLDGAGAAERLLFV